MYDTSKLIIEFVDSVPTTWENLLKQLQYGNLFKMYKVGGFSSGGFNPETGKDE